MSLAKSKMSLGLDIFNCTFSCPGDTDGRPAGWEFSATPSASTAIADGPSPGHTRAQRITIASSDTANVIIYAHPIPNRLCVQVATPLKGVMVVRSAGGASSTCKMGLRWYNSAYTGISSDDIGASPTITSTADSDWELVTKTETITPPANAAFVRPYIQVGKPTSGSVNWDLAFFGVGFWDGSAYEYEWTRFYTAQGTSCRIQARRGNAAWEDALGRSVYVSTVRFTNRHQGVFGVSGIPQALKDALDKAFRANVGSSSEANPATNHAGGPHPILWVPGHPAFPLAMLADFDESSLPIDAGRRGWLPEDPLWAGEVAIRERP